VTTLKTTYIDSNIFIAVLNIEAATNAADELFVQAMAKRNLISSIIVFGEVLRGGVPREADKFLNQVPVRFVDVDKGIMLMAADVRRSHGSLKLPDAIHIATAITMGCAAFISQDKKLVAVAANYLKSYSL
jgi:predicted nucleic acid-binding protein